MAERPAAFVDGRVVGGYSLHEAAKEPCPGWNCRWRTVDCEGFAGPGSDIVECSECGAQRKTACNFDEDYA